MGCWDCSKLHHRCKASCCAITPIPKDIFERNKHKIVTQPQEILECVGPDVPDSLEDLTAEDIGVLPDIDLVVPTTPTMKCCFLNQDYSCNIYEDRPNVCRKFGDESHAYMTCIFQDKEGRVRSRQEQRALTRKIDGVNEKFKIFKESCQERYNHL